MKKALYASLLIIILLVATSAYVLKPVAAQEEEKTIRLPFFICAYIPQDWNTTDKYTFLKSFDFKEIENYYSMIILAKRESPRLICHVNLIFWSLGEEYTPSKDALREALMNGEGVIFIADGVPTGDIYEVLDEAGIVVNTKDVEEPSSYVGPILLRLEAIDDLLLEDIVDVDIYAWKSGAFIESIEGQFVRKIGEIGPSEIYQAFPYGTRVIIITNAAGFGDREDTFELFKRLLLWAGYAYPGQPGSWKLTRIYREVFIKMGNLINKLNESLLSCQAEIENMTAEKEDLIDQIEELEQKLEECQASLNATGAETSHIEELKKTIETLQSQVSRLNKELELKSGEIEKLNSQLANMRSELQKASSERDRLSNLLKGVTLGLPAAVAGIPITAVFIAVIIALAAFSAILLVGGYRPKVPRKR